jgi:hypothetical protein
VVYGGSARDVLLGGAGADALYGGADDDMIIGDGGMVERDGNTIVMQTVDLFTGGDDTLDGGLGLDRMMGAFGNDLFFADFSEDIVLGEYGRYTFDYEPQGEEDKATSVISLAQGKLDLIRQQQVGLYSQREGDTISGVGSSVIFNSALESKFSENGDVAAFYNAMMPSFEGSPYSDLSVVHHSSQLVNGDDIKMAPLGDEYAHHDVALPDTDVKGDGVKGQGVELTNDGSTNDNSPKTADPEQELGDKAVAPDGEATGKTEAPADAEQLADMSTAIIGMAGWSMVQSTAGKKGGGSRMERADLGELSKRVAKKRLLRWDDIHCKQMEPLSDDSEK